MSVANLVFTLSSYLIFQLKWACRLIVKGENIQNLLMSAVRISDVSSCLFPW